MWIGEVAVEFKTESEPTLNFKTVVDYAFDEEHTGGTSHIQASIVSLPEKM